MTSVNLPEGCDLNTYFTGTIKNLILSTSSQTGTQQSSPQLLQKIFLEEVKFELANIKLNRPKDNLSQGERNALKELSRDKNIVKKADKGATTVIMNTTDKLNRSRVQRDHMHNYRPLDKPMVDTTAKKVHRLIRSPL